MTVSSSINRNDYAGNGSTTSFAVSFRFLENSHIKATLRDALSTETLQVETTDYTLTGAGGAGGGTLVMIVAPPSGTTLTIQRDVPATQETDYVENDEFPAESHEDALDKLTMLVQQQGEDSTRHIGFSDTVSDATGSAVELSQDATQRADKFLGFDAAGNIVTKTASSAGLVDQDQQDKRYGTIFATVAAMTAANPVSIDGVVVTLVAGMSVHTQGYTTAGDGGEKTLLVTASQSVDEFGSHTAANGTSLIIQPGEAFRVAQFGAVGDGVADDKASIQAAIDAIPSMETRRIIFEAKTYKILTGLAINPTAIDNITAVLEGQGGGMFGLSNIASTRLVTDQAIDMITIGPSTATIWSGSVVRGITFQDTSVSNDQVSACIRVQRENNGIIDNCSFEDIKAGIGIEADGPSGNPQYWYIRNCKWFQCKFGVFHQQTAADWTIEGGTFWGVNVGDALISGGVGFFIRGTTKFFGTHVQYVDKCISFTGSPASKVIGCALENDPSQPGTTGIDIVSGDGVQIISTDIVNGFSSQHILIQSGVKRTAILSMEDTTGTGTIQDNGTETLILDSSASRTSKFPSPTVFASTLTTTGVTTLNGAAVMNSTATFNGEPTFNQATMNLLSGVKIVVSGANPEGSVTAPVGSLHLRTTGGAGFTLAVKESGTGNTGWANK